jgi:hypothetical protein
MTEDKSIYNMYIFWDIYYKYINEISLPMFSCIKNFLHMQAIQLSNQVIIHLIHSFSIISKTLK